MSDTTPVVVLVGPPGAGKTTVGQALADRLGVGFTDTDSRIEAATGQPIGELFVEHGEAHFRDLEREAVAAALTEPGVVALGGGAVVDPDTRRRLAGHRVVFLRVGLAAAAARVGLGVARPLLLGNVRTQLKTLMDRREPLYREVAGHVVDTDAGDVGEVVETLLGMLDEH